MSYNKTLFFGGEMKNENKIKDEDELFLCPRCTITVPLKWKWSFTIPHQAWGGDILDF